MYGNAASVDEKGRIFLNYHSRNRTESKEVYYSLIPNMVANTPNHIETELCRVSTLSVLRSLCGGSPDSTALLDVIQNIVLSEGLPYPTVNGKWIKDPRLCAGPDDKR